MYDVLRLHASIIGTLAGTSFLGPVAGHSATTHALEELRADRVRSRIETQGVTSGNVEALSTGEEGDSYVKIKKMASEEDADDAAEEEEGEGKASDDAEGDEKSAKQ